MLHFIGWALALLILAAIYWRMTKMSEVLDRLKAEVAETRSAVDSAVALIAGLAQQIRDSVNDTEALNALADDLDAQQTTLAEAVQANTPNAPAPLPENPAVLPEQGTGETPAPDANTNPDQL